MPTLEQLIVAAVAVVTIPAAAGPIGGLGRTPSAAEIAAYDIDVGADGQGLPAGSGTALQGAAIYAVKCVACHGATGVEGPRDKLVGGKDTLASDKPLKTVGSYWPYATTVYDYIHRAMPFTQPGTLTPDEVYALTAFLLYRNGIVGETDVMDRETLPKVRMPNRDGFIEEPSYRELGRR